jgi:hypothetical protein
MNEEIDYKSLTGGGIVDMKKLHEIVNRYYCYDIPPYKGNIRVDDRGWKSDFKHTKKGKK